MTPDCFDSTALPEGPPHLIDRLDAAIADVEHELESYELWAGWPDGLSSTMREIAAVAREARDLLDAEGFGR